MAHKILYRRHVGLEIHGTAFTGWKVLPAILPACRPQELVKPRRAAVANQKAKWGRTCK